MIAFRMLSIRGLIHWSCNLCLIYSLLWVPVMVNISVFYLWVIFAIISSHFFLNERANFIDGLLSIIGFGGVIMISDPTFSAFSELNTEHMEGMLLIMVSALFYCLNMVIMRKWR